MTIKVINVINVIFIIIIFLYLSIIKRKVKIQSHFSPPCGGRNSFGIFSQICFHFHFLLLLFLFQKWFHFHFLLLLLILSKQSNQRCQQTRLTLLFSFQSFSVPIIGSLPNPILNSSQKKVKGQPFISLNALIRFFWRFSQVLTSSQNGRILLGGG